MEETRQAVGAHGELGRREHTIASLKQCSLVDVQSLARHTVDREVFDPMLAFRLPFFDAAGLFECAEKDPHKAPTMRTWIPNRIVCLSHGVSSGKPRNLSTATSTEVAKPSTSTTSANSAAVLLSTLPGRKLRIALTSALSSVSSFGDSGARVDDASPIAPSSPALN